MTCRAGVLLLFFDMPAVTKEDKRNYRRFMKQLKAMGFIRFQESVYVQFVRNIENIGSTISRLESISHPDESVSLLPIRLNAFNRMVVISGEKIDANLFLDDIITI